MFLHSRGGTPHSSSVARNSEIERTTCRHASRSSRARPPTRSAPQHAVGPVREGEAQHGRQHEGHDDQIQHVEARACTRDDARTVTQPACVQHRAPRRAATRSAPLYWSPSQFSEYRSFRSRPLLAWRAHANDNQRVMHALVCVCKRSCSAVRRGSTRARRLQLPKVAERRRRGSEARVQRHKRWARSGRRQQCSARAQTRWFAARYSSATRGTCARAGQRHASPRRARSSGIERTQRLARALRLLAQALGLLVPARAVADAIIVRLATAARCARDCSRRRPWCAKARGARGAPQRRRQRSELRTRAGHYTSQREARPRVCESRRPGSSCCVRAQQVQERLWEANLGGVSACLPRKLSMRMTGGPSRPCTREPRADAKLPPRQRAPE